MTLMLGKKAAVRPFGLSELSVYTRCKLPAPPPSIPAPTGVNWGMDLNDQYGICTLAGVDHLIASVNAVLRTTDPRPSTAQLNDTYFSMTGGDDTGLVEADVLKSWQTTGLFGNKILGYAPINRRNLVGLHQATAFYLGAYLGIQCPASAQDQFANNQPWTVVPGSPIEGGHAIVAVGYTPTALLCVSWGQVVEVTYPFLAHFLDEAWCVLFQAVMEHNGDGLGIDFTTLSKDLHQV